MNNNLLEEMLEFFEKKVKELKEKSENDTKNKLSNITFKNENLEALRKNIIDGVLDLPNLTLTGKAKALMEAYFMAQAENMNTLLEEIEKLGAKELFLCHNQKN